MTYSFVSRENMADYVVYKPRKLGGIVRRGWGNNYERRGEEELCLSLGVKSQGIIRF